MEKATFGAGCFWHVEEAFRQTPGILSTSVGFMGGTRKSPTYKEVCAGGTGHAEVVQLVYDPEKVSYDELLEVFWEIHDPTSLNRQGPDVGEQYRSVIFCHSEEQEARAKASMERLTKSSRCKREIVTQILPAGEFYPAEDYHQQYLAKRGISAAG